jgi:hypothetical protein
VRDPAWAAVVNADPELRQYVRNVKMSAEDQKARMRTVAAPIFAAQVGQLKLWRVRMQPIGMHHSILSGSRRHRSQVEVVYVRFLTNCKPICHAMPTALFLLQMNALHEPWNDSIAMYVSCQTSTQSWGHLYLL